MKVTNIKFEEGSPSEVTVSMSTGEAAYIAKVLGKHNYHSASEYMTNGGAHNNEIYDCLVGEFFNRFWEDGVDDIE